MEDSAHVQAVFSSEDGRFCIPCSQFSIPVTATRVQLNELVNQIAEYATSTKAVNHEFDFLIFSDLLHDSLERHVSLHQLSTEEVLQIQCIERNPSPSLALELDHKDWVSAIHCYGNLILTGCYDNKVRVWTYKGILVCVAQGHTAPVKDVRWISATDRDWLFLSASQDQHVHLWRMTLEAEYKGGDDITPVGHVTLLHQCKGHAKSVQAIDVSSDRSKFCSVSWDGFLKIWSTVPDPSLLHEVERESDLPAKKSKSNSIHHRPPTTRTPLFTYEGHKSAATTVVWARRDARAGLDGDIITGGWDNCIRMWDSNTGVNKGTLNCSKSFNCIALNCNSNLIASGNSDRIVRLWDARQSEASLIHSSLTSHSGWVVTVKWSPTNPHHLVSGSYDSTLRLWDTRSTKKPLFSIAAHEGKVLCANWSDPNVLASGGTDKKLRTYRI